MPTDPPSPAEFIVRHDADELPFGFGPPAASTVADIIASFNEYCYEYDMMCPGVARRFEVWCDGVMVATVRRHPTSGEYVEGPPFDETRGIPARVVDLFEDFANRPK